MRIEVLLGIGLVMWVFSFDANAQDYSCPLTIEESKTLKYQAIALEAEEYEAALQKCIDKVPLTRYERMLNRTASSYLSSLSADAEQMGKEAQVAAEAEANRSGGPWKLSLKKLRIFPNLQTIFQLLPRTNYAFMKLTRWEKAVRFEPRQRNCAFSIS